jgi:hypothetical protein
MQTLRVDSLRMDVAFHIVFPGYCLSEVFRTNSGKRVDKLCAEKTIAKTHV